MVYVLIVVSKKENKMRKKVDKFFNFLIKVNKILLILVVILTILNVLNVIVMEITGTILIHKLVPELIPEKSP